MAEDSASTSTNKRKFILNRVLVCDAVDDAAVDLLQRNQITVILKEKQTEQDLIKNIKDFNALIVRSETKITAAVIEAGAASALRLIGRAGVGVDNIDVETASKHNIIVINSPTGNTTSACELTCMLIGLLGRPIIPAVASLRDGKWERKQFIGMELSGRTLAIIGLGHVGREVGIRMRSWGMRVIGYDPFVSSDQAKNWGIERNVLDDIYAWADFITIHTPLIPSTRGLINAEVLKKCKKGVKIINVARGGIVNELDLLNALLSGHCGGAAIDVYDGEPPKSDVQLSLIQHPKVIATPHIGASTDDAQTRVACDVAQQFVWLANRRYKECTGIVNSPVIENIEFISRMEQQAMK